MIQHVNKPEYFMFLLILLAFSDENRNVLASRYKTLCNKYRTPFHNY